MLNTLISYDGCLKLDEPKINSCLLNYHKKFGESILFLEKEMNKAKISKIPQVYSLIHVVDDRVAYCSLYQNLLFDTRQIVHLSAWEDPLERTVDGMIHKGMHGFIQEYGAIRSVHSLYERSFDCET